MQDRQILRFLLGTSYRNHRQKNIETAKLTRAARTATPIKIWSVPNSGTWTILDLFLFVLSLLTFAFFFRFPPNSVFTNSDHFAHFAFDPLNLRQKLLPWSDTLLCPHPCPQPTRRNGPESKHDRSRNCYAMTRIFPFLPELSEIVWDGLNALKQKKTLKAKKAQGLRARRACAGLLTAEWLSGQLLFQSISYRIK
jgi:hypothetical protein